MWKVSHSVCVWFATNNGLLVLIEREARNCLPFFFGCEAVYAGENPWRLPLRNFLRLPCSSRFYGLLIRVGVVAGWHLGFEFEFDAGWNSLF
jgi:hypothetical protein